jgi:hypothetical protein
MNKPCWWKLSELFQVRSINSQIASPFRQSN